MNGSGVVTWVFVLCGATLALALVGCGGATTPARPADGLGCGPAPDAAAREAYLDLARARCAEPAPPRDPPADGFSCTPPTAGSAATPPEAGVREAYLDLVRASCAEAVTRAVVQACTDIDPDDYMLVFSEISSVELSSACAFGVVGYLSTHASPTRPTEFKSYYLGTVYREAEQLREHGDPAAQAHLDNTVAYAIGTIIDDITTSGIEGQMIGALYALRLDLREGILRHVDYERPLSGVGRDWGFNEYAACMCDAGAPARLAAALSRSTPQDLRNHFSALWAAQRRGRNCLSPQLVRWLVEPYASDTRPTVEIHGDGPAVCSSAQDLLEAL